MWKEKNITMKKEVYNVKYVERAVKLAISQYCRERNISQGHYLKTDERIQELLKKLSTENS